MSADMDVEKYLSAVDDLPPEPGDSAEPEVYEDDEPETAPAAEPPAEAAPSVNVLDMSLPDDDRVPEFVRGKKVNEVFENANRKISEQGQELGRLRQEAERAKVLQATLDVIAMQKQAQSAERQSDPYDRISQDLVSDDPTKAFRGTAEIASRNAVEQITPEVQRLQARLEHMEQQAQIQRIAQAAEQARLDLNIDPQTWRSAGQLMWAVAGQENPEDPRSWSKAWKAGEQAYGAAYRQPAEKIPQEGVVRGATAAPGTTRSAAVPTGNRGLKPRVRGMVRDVVEFAGLDDATAARIEAKLQQMEKD